MSGPPRVKFANHPDSEIRHVLVPAGNKARSVELRKPVEKLNAIMVEKPVESADKKFQAMPVETGAESDPLPKSRLPAKRCTRVGSVMSQQKEHRSFLMRSNLWMNASCSSDASSDSSHSRASTGRVSGRTVTVSSARKKKQCSSKVENAGKVASEAHSLSVSSEVVSVVKKKCSWVTSSTDPIYSTFHDEEWDAPVHDDRKLFELLSLSIALAELTWPTILSRRQTFKSFHLWCEFGQAENDILYETLHFTQCFVPIHACFKILKCREVFHNFGPVVVSKLNEKKVITPGSTAIFLLSELKLRAVIDNAHQFCKIINENGSFNKYIWDFVNNNPVVSNYRYPQQVPIKTSKDEMISKYLVKRGFCGVGPTVVYSFMQAAGITNDHLIGCFRF